jgi:hypothetical protein
MWKRTFGIWMAGERDFGLGWLRFLGWKDGGFVESYRANLMDVAEIALEFLTQLKFRRDYLLDITG